MSLASTQLCAEVSSELKIRAIRTDGRVVGIGGEKQVGHVKRSPQVHLYDATDQSSTANGEYWLRDVCVRRVMPARR